MIALVQDLRFTAGHLVPMLVRFSPSPDDFLSLLAKGFQTLVYCLYRSASA
jgi:hypothetical protein